MEEGAQGPGSGWSRVMPVPEEPSSNPWSPVLAPGLPALPRATGQCQALPRNSTPNPSFIRPGGAQDHRLGKRGTGFHETLTAPRHRANKKGPAEAEQAPGRGQCSLSRRLALSTLVSLTWTNVPASKFLEGPPVPHPSSVSASTHAHTLLLPCPPH